LPTPPPAASWPPEFTPPLPLVEPAPTAQPLGAGAAGFQSLSTPLQPALAPAAPGAGPAPAPAPLTAAVPRPVVPDTEVAAAPAALWPRALAPEDTVFPVYEAAPAPRPRPERQEQTAATV